MKIRSFIAINLPENLKKEIGFLLERLKKENKRIPVKWVSNEGLHITLHFLGSQEENTLQMVGEKIEKKIKELHLNQKAPKLIATEINAFPNLSWPRVLFIGYREDGEKHLIKKLQKGLSKELEKLGIEIDKREWTPHLTLARLKTPAKLKMINDKLQDFNFEVRSIDLMKSELTPLGAKYTILKKFPF
ncbi:MAG: RNA 2',3'-cyclic phosphodiesterase [Patescibacteria group bacterium]|nr:RNA 2',3'-cyclic phosphodiesterase [Patescibacteria group bacterium]